MSKRKFGLEYNGSDDEDYDHIPDLTPDQFVTNTSSSSASRPPRYPRHNNDGHKPPYQPHHSRPNANSTQLSEQPGQFLNPQGHTFQNTADDVAAHYDQIAKAAANLNRHQSKILPLRNLNNWIKSVGINIAIFTAQQHINQLARELNIDPAVVGLLKNVPPNKRILHSLFEMQQRADGIWDLSINPSYPLPIDVDIKLSPIYDHISDTFISPTLSPPQTNTTYAATHGPDILGIPAHSSYINRALQQNQNVYALDLCGGKGGDLLKWMENDIGGYVLSDISKLSVLEALKRYNESIHGKRGKKPFFAQFITANLTEHLLHDFLHPRISFDVVAISFAFHYSFKTESDLRRMIQNVADRLRPGGCFTCTVPDSRVLMSRLVEKQELFFHNPIYKIEFKPTVELLNWLKVMQPQGQMINYLHKIDIADITSSPDVLLWCKRNYPTYFKAVFAKLTPHEVTAFTAYEETHSSSAQSDLDFVRSAANAELDAKQIKHNGDLYDPIYERPLQPSPHPFHSFSPFGIEYKFTLAEAVDGVPEYLVLYPTLCQIAAEYGLKPVLYENLQTFLSTQFRHDYGKNSNYNLFKTIRAFDIFPPNHKSNNKWGNHNNNQGDSSKPFDPVQWEGVGVYCTMMFQKVGEIQYQGHTVYYDDISLTTSPLTAAVDNTSLDSYCNDITQLGETGGKGMSDDMSFRNSPANIEQLDRIFGRYSSQSHKNRHDAFFAAGIGERTFADLALPPISHLQTGNTNGEENDANETRPADGKGDAAEAPQQEIVRMEKVSSAPFPADIVPPMLFDAFETLPSVIYPDVQSAGGLGAGHFGYRYWSDYTDLSAPLPDASMIVCGEVIQQAIMRENEENLQQAQGGEVPMKTNLDYFTPTL